MKIPEIKKIDEAKLFCSVVCVTNRDLGKTLKLTWKPQRLRWPAPTWDLSEFPSYWCRIPTPSPQAYVIWAMILWNRFCTISSHLSSLCFLVLLPLSGSNQTCTCAREREFAILSVTDMESSNTVNFYIWSYKSDPSNPWRSPITFCQQSDSIAHLSRTREMDPFPAIYQSDRFDNLQRTLHPTVPAIKTQVTFDEWDRERKKL